jgi:acyl carrier protein
MTSSISSLLSNVGQANYVAANAFIDAFSYYRQAQSLPATTLNIGILAEIGVIARSEELSKYVDLLAIRKTPVKDMIQILEAMLADNIVHAGAFECQWTKWEKVEPKAARSPRFVNILKAEHEKSEQSDANGGANILEILGEDEKEAIEVLSMLIKEGVASVLRCDPNKVDITTNLNYMGIDSLMVSELRNNLISQFDVEISLVELLKGVSIKDIAGSVLVKLKEMSLA